MQGMNSKLVRMSIRKTLLQLSIFYEKAKGNWTPTQLQGLRISCAEELIVVVRSDNDPAATQPGNDTIDSSFVT